MLRLPTPVECDQLLRSLDRIGTSFGGPSFAPSEYGLPTHDAEAVERMRMTILAWIANLDQEVAGVFHTTLDVWMKHGPQLVQNQSFQTVRIVDRFPHHITDSTTPEPMGGYGWQFGWRCMDSGAECSRWTLNEEIFHHLPECPYILRKGMMPRWPTAQEAQSALTEAALKWARSKSDTAGAADEGFILIQMMRRADRPAPDASGDA